MQGSRASTAQLGRWRCDDMHLILALTLLAPPAGPYVPLTPADHAGAPSFGAHEPVVGTHFFYWYKQSVGEHWIDHDGTDALTDHPLYRGEDYAYDSEEWWVRQIAKVREAGLDFMALVYWGMPGMDDSDHPVATGLSWSNVGARTLSKILERQLAAGEEVLPVGMFYDTTTLRYNYKDRQVPLDTDWGRQWFYETIRDFYSMIPPRAWARIDGDPIVILYGSAYAASQDDDLFQYVERRFEDDFGTGVHIIKNHGWPGDADDIISWGGALGLKLNTTAAVGPGYDHSAVPGREPLVVEREGGDFYVRNWEDLLSRHPRVRPTLVMVETWNELHEGTEVEPTIEYGHQYVYLTKHYADLWREVAYLPPEGPYTDAEVITWEPLESRGVDVPDVADGPVRKAYLDGRLCLTTDPTRPGEFLYVDAHRSFAFDQPATPVKVELTYWDDGYREAWIEYDSLDPDSSVRAGAFKRGPALPPSTGEGWRTVTFEIDDMRFGDRCNGADMRLAMEGSAPALSEARVRRVR
ncbi:MAG: hypothetical protein GF320_20360 [Armatimonadia bacterium]|nr:hypothetical protein [Armatimonadia bacterium]